MLSIIRLRFSCEGESRPMGQVFRDEYQKGGVRTVRQAHTWHSNCQIWVVSGDALVEITARSSSIATCSMNLLLCAATEEPEWPISMISGGAPKAEESTRGRDQLECWKLLYRPRIAGPGYESGADQNVCGILRMRCAFESNTPRAHSPLSHISKTLTLNNPHVKRVFSRLTCPLNIPNRSQTQETARVHPM